MSYRLRQSYINRSRAKFSFNICFGKGNLANINGVEFRSDYYDDVCIFIGDQKIYLKRHIYRAATEAIQFFKEHYKDTEFSFHLR
jgi:hypothetical protein